MLLTFLLALGLAVLSAFRLHAQNVDESLTLATGSGQVIQGRIDWTDQALIAYGEGVAPAGLTDPAQRRLLGFRAARTVAYRNLLELVGQVQIDAETKVANAMVASDEIRTRVSGIVRGARVLPGSQQEVDGLYRIALQLDLRHAFADAVLPDSSQGRPAPPPPATPPPAAADSLTAPETPVFVPPKPYTGLLVDARGLDLQPSMAPRLLGEDGRVVYSPALVERGYATRMGVVGYDKNLERARTSDRLGGAQAHPLIVKALQVAGPYRADLVIGREEGIRVAMADAKSGFLSQCRVVFVLGPLPAPVDAPVVGSAAVDSTLIERNALDLPGETAPGRRPE